MLPATEDTVQKRRKDIWLTREHAVQGTIPVEWNKLANPLVTLDLSDNNLTGVPER